jgi:hypothetical protein
VAPVAASGGLLVMLLAGACARPTAAPEPVVVPTISSSAPVTSIPAVASISVRAAETTTLPPTVAETTEPPPPPPPPAQVQPPVQPEPTVQPTRTEPEWDEVALEGFPCAEEDAQAIDPAGRQLTCEPTRRGRLIWQRG